MSHRPINVVGPALYLGGVALATIAFIPFPQAAAHQIEVSRDVGATLHVEPNDRPRAGVETLVWFALTQKGGRGIPLAQCNCQLEVYPQPETTTPLLTPALRAVSAERFQGIPGADITFPKAGGYLLKLSGTPTGEIQFDPFELTFEVLVTR
ncbi:MAG: hypothetical protein AAFY11_00370 [Cyanobacteria bacterium J06641_5]